MFCPEMGGSLIAHAVCLCMLIGLYCSSSLKQLKKYLTFLFLFSKNHLLSNSSAALPHPELAIYFEVTTSLHLKCSDMGDPTLLYFQHWESKPL
jgi:hypothetical protein